MLGKIKRSMSNDSSGDPARHNWSDSLVRGIQLISLLFLLETEREDRSKRRGREDASADKLIRQAFSNQSSVSSEDLAVLAKQNENLPLVLQNGLVDSLPSSQVNQTPGIKSSEEFSNQEDVPKVLLLDEEILKLLDPEKDDFEKFFLQQN